MDQIIERLRRIDEGDVSKEDYQEIADLVSEYHLDEAPLADDEEYARIMTKTDAVEDALLAAAYEDKSIDVSQCILVLRGHKNPQDADLPKASLEAYDEAMEDDEISEEVEELIGELFDVIDDR